MGIIGQITALNNTRCMIYTCNVVLFGKIGEVYDRPGMKTKWRRLGIQTTGEETSWNVVTYTTAEEFGRCY